MVSVSLETEHMLDQLDLHLAPSSDSTVNGGGDLQEIGWY